MGRQKIQDLAKEILVKTTKNLEENVSKYLVACHLLFVSFGCMSVDKIKNRIGLFRKIKMRLDAENHDLKTFLISKSKVISNIIKINELSVSISPKMENEEVVTNLKCLECTKSLEVVDGSWIRSCNEAALEVGKRFKEL